MINNMTEDFNFLLEQYGKEVKINNIPIKATIFNAFGKEKIRDYKIIRTNIPIKQGNVVYYQNRYWFMFGEIKETNGIYKGFIRKCQEVKINNNNIPALVDNKIFDIEEGKYFNLVDNQILITINNTNKIKINDVITFNKRGYKVIAVDDTMENLSICKCKYSSVDTHFYNIELNTTSITIEQEQTFQIVATVKDGTAPVENPTLIYTVEDETICSVDNTGLVTGLEVGSTTIKVKFEDVEETLQVTVIEKAEEETYTLNGSSTINLENSITYRIYNQDNIEPTDKTFTFNLLQSAENPNISPQTLIKDIDILSGTSVKLTANTSTKGYFILQAVCNEYPEIVLEKEIKVKGVFDW